LTIRWRSSTLDFRVIWPNWTWHDHYNEGDEPVMWIDGLDIRMVAMGKMLGEGYAQDQHALVWRPRFV
jgi:gentisate 1,2-dioxygenase